MGEAKSRRKAIESKVGKTDASIEEEEESGRIFQNQRWARQISSEFKLRCRRSPVGQEMLESEFTERLDNLRAEAMSYALIATNVKVDSNFFFKSAIVQYIAIQ